MALFGGDAPIVAALQAEIARAHEREKLLLAQIADITNKLSALADTRAHLASQPRKDTPHPERRPPSMRLPAGIASLAAGGHVNLRDVRALYRQKLKGVDVSAAPPLVDE